MLWCFIKKFRKQQLSLLQKNRRYLSLKWKTWSGRKNIHRWSEIIQQRRLIVVGKSSNFAKPTKKSRSRRTLQLNSIKRKSKFQSTKQFGLHATNQTRLFKSQIIFRTSFVSRTRRHYSLTESKQSRTCSEQFRTCKTVCWANYKFRSSKRFGLLHVVLILLFFATTR